MKHHRFRRILSLILVAALLAGNFVPGVQAAATNLTWKETDQVVRPDLSDRKADIQVDEPYKDSDIVRVSIVLEDKSTIQAGFATRNIARNSQAMAYSQSLRAKQDTLAQTISAQVLGGKKLDVKWNLTLVGNIISANVPYGKIEAIARVAGVQNVVLENTYAPCVVEREDVANPQMYASLSMAGSSLVWSSGFTGAGSRIAVVDTGTDTDHQSLDGSAFLYALEQNALAAGMDYEDYLASLDLLDAQEIASVLSYLNIYETDSTITAAKLYLNEKLPFAVNYVDSRSYRYVVDHENSNDYQGEHGSHVAGIATANRYIPSGDGYADALETVRMAGNAPDAQLITMKVFGISGGPTDADYMAAIEDAIILGCDAVNLSLGTGMAGSGINPTYADMLEYMTQTDTVVVASAGNSYSWPSFGPYGYLYSNDVNMDAVGAPGSNYSFLTVASVENDGGVGLAFNAAGHSAMYTDTSDGSCYTMSSLDTSADLSGTEYDFIFIDGMGYEEDYTGMDLSGKVVFCSRGTLNFHTKADNAASLGAIATVIYNNQSGSLSMDLSDYNHTAPCVSISQRDANAIRAAAARQTTTDGLTYYTGKITVYGSPIGVVGNSEYYTMSDFSSWGVPGDLSIKPEITAPGGNIYSLYGESYHYGGGTDQYELMSGTSMSAPQVTGMSALMAQYLRESGLAEQESMSVRHLAQSLLMSTAVPMLEEATGNYYSILKQGAGLARVDLATSAASYILVDGQEDGKVKAELGDDPDRTGVYEFTFSINNLSGKDESYTLSADIFRQDTFDYGEASSGTANGVTLLATWTDSLPATAAFTVNGTELAPRQDLSSYDLNGDGVTNAQDADYLLEYLLGNEAALHGTGDVSGDGTANTYDAHALLASLSSGLVEVPANGSVTVSVRLALTAAGRQLLDDNYKNGTYVQAFVYAESASDTEGVTGTSHSIPVLAFYGNWSDPGMFDYSSAVDMMYGNYDTLMPYMYNEIYSSANALTIDYGDGGEYYFGGNPYVTDDSYIPERNAFSSMNASTLEAQYFTLIRNAGEMQLVITNTDTGEVYMNRTLGECNAAYYYVNGGYWTNIEQGVNLNWSGTDGNGDPLPQDTQVNVSLIAAPEYYRGSDGTYNLKDLGEGAFLTTQMTIDNTAPLVNDMELVDTTLTVTAQDNRHVAAVAVMNVGGTTTFAIDTPNQTVAEAEVTVALDLTGVTGTEFLLSVYDYAGNTTTYTVELDLPEVERPYFTVVDYQNSIYYGLSANGTATALATGTRGTIQAAEFVDGYVFEVTEGGNLYVASDSDLNNFKYLTQLDSNNEYSIANFLDLAYSYADNTLYGLFYCDLNYEATPYLCAIDMHSAQWEVLHELPVDVHNMAIDDAGNFYSVCYNSTSLYTYTLETLESGTMNYVGEVGYYSTSRLNSLAWDHDADTLYWAYPSTLLQVDPATGTPTLISYFDMGMTGLYIRPTAWGNQFASSEVSSVTVDLTEARVLVGGTISLTGQVWPWYVSDSSITWSSSDSSIATVSASGVVTGVAEGSVTITATSSMDPTRYADCKLTVVDLNKDLNALIWDEAGDIWWSEFNTSSLPGYTKLTATPAADYLATSAVMPDGTLYVSTMDIFSGYLASTLYSADPDTFELTGIGVSSNAYTDIAAAPNIRGGALAATYGTYVLFVDLETGDYYYNDGDYFQLFSNNTVAIAYAGSMPYQDYGYDTTIDWFFIIDQEGYVYLLGFLEQDGTLYYLPHPDTVNGVYTVTNAVSDTGFYSSAHFDGEFLYYSCYNSAKNVSTLYAIDTMGSHQCYNLGNFGDGVWPAGGLMELDTPPTSDLLNFKPTAEPQKAETSSEIAALCVSQESRQPVSGGLNAVAEPLSDGGFDSETDQITVTLTPSEDATNGKMVVNYDAEALSLVSITGHTEAFAYNAEDGTITVAFASAGTVAETQAIATLTFDVLEAGDQSINITHKESNNAASTFFERLVIPTGCVHSYEAAIHDPTCTERGYTQYFCKYCDHSYNADYVDALGHSYEEGVCTTCGEEDPDYVAVVASGWSGDTTWVLTADGVMTFSGTGKTRNYGYNRNQPWLSYKDQIKSVVIEEGVTAIGTGTFMGLTSLESVTLPDSGLSKIGEAAFYGCTALKEVYIPDGVYTIWAYTFKNCTSLEEVRLPKTLIKIDQGAFENCTALDYIFIPTNVEIFGSWSFKGCTGLKEADMQWADATEIREGAFKNCAALTTIVLPANIQKFGDSAFYGIGAKSFTVPATVTEVGPWCFARASLTEIVFEGSAPTIGEGAFNKITLTAYYPSGNATWAADNMLNYGGTVTWKAQ